MHSVHFCRCNLHGASGGKGLQLAHLVREAVAAICTERVEAKNLLCFGARCFAAAICTERVEAKPMIVSLFIAFPIVICTERVETKRSHTHVFSPFGLL